jgi:endoglucanase
MANLNKQKRCGPAAVLLAIVATTACKKPPAPKPSVAVVSLPREAPAVDEAEPELSSTSTQAQAPIPEELLIDDCEDGNNQVSLVAHRNGYWYTYADTNGTQATPLPGALGGVFTMSSPGHSGSRFAARIHGRMGNHSLVFVGAGLNLVDPRDTYDASPYDGIAFWAKRGPRSAAKLRVKVPDLNTAPDGGICSECFNDFGATIELTEQWQRYLMPFNEMRQEPQWGNPRPPAITPSAIYTVLFQLSEPGADFDVWIDDVAFVD